MSTGLQKVSFPSNPKIRQCQRIFKLTHNCTHLTCQQTMLKILQARFQQYVNCELPGVQDGYRKTGGTRNQIANIHCIIKKAKEFQKNIYLYIIDYAKSFNCVYYNNLWKILQEMGIPDHLTCLRRKLYAGQEATVQTWRGTQTGSKLRKECYKAVFHHRAYWTYKQRISCAKLC